jgi:hypothetical protein
VRGGLVCGCTTSRIELTQEQHVMKRSLLDLLGKCPSDLHVLTSSMQHALLSVVRCSLKLTTESDSKIGVTYMAASAERLLPTTKLCPGILLVIFPNVHRTGVAMIWLAFLSLLRLPFVFWVILFTHQFYPPHLSQDVIKRPFLIIFELAPGPP